MNTLADIRQEVFDRLTWDPDPAQSAIDRIDRRIGSAIRELATQAPNGFFEQTRSIEMEPDDVSGSAGDTVSGLVASDYGADVFPSGDRGNPWVFRTNAERDAYTGDTTAWNTERAWDGRLIELTDAAGVTYWNQIRTVWKESLTEIDPVPAGKSADVPAAWDEYRFSVVTPWNSDLGTGPYTWRVVTAAYALPSQILRLSSLYLQKGRKEISLLSQDQIEEKNWDNRTPESQEGPPLWAYRRNPTRLNAPAVPPTVAHHASTVWAGPEPFGEFKYLLTYTWGKAGKEQTHPGVGYFDDVANPFDVSAAHTVRNLGSNRSRLPRWESGPSSYSETIEVATVPITEGGFTAAKAVQLTLPNIEYVLGFMLKGTMTAGAFNRASISRSGIHVRIYRTRLTEDYTNYDQLSAGAAGQQIDSLHKMDVRQEPQLLAEIRIDPSNEGIFVDDGTILPDRHIKPTSQGVYPGISLYPRPQDVDRLDVRYIQAPEVPTLDTDVIPVNDAGREAIVHKVIAMEVGSNDTNLAAMHRRMGREAIESLNKAADLTPQDQVKRKRAARSRRRGRRIQ